MSTTNRATIEDLYGIPGNGKAEIVKELAEKRRDYFAAGTLVVWDVDLLCDDVVKVYRYTDHETPMTYRRGDLAEAEPAIPGWRIAVDELLT